MFSIPSFLYEQVIKDADTPGSDHDFGKNIIPSIIDQLPGFRLPVSVIRKRKNRPIGAMSVRWMPTGKPIWNWFQYCRNLICMTTSGRFSRTSNQAPSGKICFDYPGRRGEAIESMVSAGCIISGASVRKSLIFSNCKIHSHSFYRRSH